MSRAVFEPKPYHDWPITHVISFFRETRLQNVKRYRTLRQDDLTKASLHPRLSLVMTPVDLAWFDAEHDDHHVVRINEILSQLLP
jgi:hypothetical protein